MSSSLVLVVVLLVMTVMVQAAPTRNNDAAPTSSQNATTTTTKATVNIPALKVKAEHYVIAVIQEIHLLEKSNVRYSMMYSLRYRIQA